MSYCKECGHALKANSNFCPECGTAVQHVHTQAPPNPNPTPVFSTWLKKIKHASKKQKIIAISVIALLLIVIGGYQVGAKMTDKERIIEKFETALQEEDAATLTKLLESSDSRLEITEEEVTKLVALISETPSALQYFIDGLEQQANAFDGDYEQDSSTIFSLEKDGKTALIYDRYYIEVMPFYFEVATNMADTQIFLGDKEIAVTESEAFSKEFGPFLPGVYTVKASFDNDYALLENQQTIELLEPYHQEQYVDLTLYGEYISFNSEYQDIADSVTYYLNDKALDIETDESFGPVSVDGSVNAHAVLSFPWGDVTTEKTAVDSRYMNLQVSNPFSEEMQTDIIDTIHIFGQDMAVANEALDPSLFTTTTSTYQDDVATSTFNSMENWNKQWIGSYEKTVVDLDSFYLSQEEDQYVLNVNAALYFDAASYYEYEDEEIDTSEIETAEEINEWQLKLIYQPEDDAWLIEDHYGLWSFNPDNTVERVMEAN
ncbi:hypothetical protein GCM10011351_17820 [Paraliobacillus quinghaiensis]|uniref:Zinc-ribbon domain-containing protein n=1 Tax=Paraliobacillus quinghaiensis TaxID=470815 RepID=A0A917WTY5_9BACI|nr:zinc-ribbon domain-containing protein [Paraliobacillus quinghaiensis]GGM32087.1 hypothetical protein GCM10011351_17820 [Paraliobacillus quinghaiensis]